MRSNNLKNEKWVTVRYVYTGIPETFEMDEPLKDVLTSLAQDREQDLYDWADDTTWLTLPRNPFEVTKLKLNKDGSPSFIQFTERKARV